MLDRWYTSVLRDKLARPYVHLVFGARQTGKSTLLRELLPSDTVVIDLSDPQERTRHLADPGAFAADCRGLPAARKARFVLAGGGRAVSSRFGSGRPPSD